MLQISDEARKALAPSRQDATRTGGRRLEQPRGRSGGLDPKAGLRAQSARPAGTAVSGPAERRAQTTRDTKRRAELRSAEGFDLPAIVSNLVALPGETLEGVFGALMVMGQGTEDILRGRRSETAPSYPPTFEALGESIKQQAAQMAREFRSRPGEFAQENPDMILDLASAGAALPMKVGKASRLATTAGKGSKAARLNQDWAERTKNLERLAKEHPSTGAAAPPKTTARKVTERHVASAKAAGRWDEIENRPYRGTSAFADEEFMVRREDRIRRKLEKREERRFKAWNAYQALPEVEKSRLDRAKSLGFNWGAFRAAPHRKPGKGTIGHGSSHDVQAYDPGLLGQASGGKSARLGFFFADPKTAGAFTSGNIEDVPGAKLQRKIEQVNEKQTEIYEELLHLSDEQAKHPSGSPEHRAAVSLGDKRLDETRRWGRIGEELRQQLKNYTENQPAGGIEDARVKLQGFVEEAATSAYDKGIDFPLYWDDVADEIADVFELVQPPEGAVWKDLDNAFEGNPEALKEVGRLREGLKQVYERRVSAPGPNIQPVVLRAENPYFYDYEGRGYHNYGDKTPYTPLIKKAWSEGHDMVVALNTRDGGPVTDIYTVRYPEQIRSISAAFDPEKRQSRDVLAEFAPIAFPVGAGTAAAAHIANQENAEETEEQ